MRMYDIFFVVIVAFALLLFAVFCLYFKSLVFFNEKNVDFSWQDAYNLNLMFGEHPANIVVVSVFDFFSGTKSMTSVNLL